MSTHVKLCGLRSPEDVDAAIAAGADMIGFILTPGRRRVDPDSVRELVERAVSAQPGIAVVGVFRDEDDETIATTVTASGINVVQLATPFDAGRVASLRALTGVPVIAVVHVDGSIDRATVTAALSAADYVLLDAVSPEGGGGAVAFNHELLDDIADLLGQVGIAGGLTADSVGDVVRRGPRFVDVSSGIEDNGRKCAAMMSEFVQSARKDQ
jgi:phosphoribosylanthranilate isomerase